MADLPMIPAGVAETCNKFGVQFAKLSELAVGDVITDQTTEITVYRNNDGELCISKNGCEIQLTALVRVGGDYLKNIYLLRHATPAERRLILADYLEKNVPDEMFDMRSYFSTTPIELRQHKCGTTGCVAGWAVALFTEFQKGVDSTLGGRMTADTAANMLGLGQHAQHQLFYDFSLSRTEAVKYLRSL